MLFLKLIALLKKDAILATRNKTWTLFELLLPVTILFIIYGMMLMVSITMDIVMEKNPPNYTDTTPIIFKEQLCEQKEIGQKVFLKSPQKFEEYDLKTKQWDRATNTPGKPRDYVKKRIGDCKEGILFAEVDDDEVTVYLPLGTRSKEKSGLKSPGQNLLDDYEFSSIIIQAILKTEPRRANVISSTLDVRPIATRKVKIPEQIMSFFYLILGVSMSVTVMNAVRTIVTEKATVKPYLSAIGLPSWLFYTEHFLAFFLKCFITCFGSLLFFVEPEYISLPLMLIGVVTYIIGAISFAILFSVIFNNAKRGIEAAMIFWMLAVFFPLFQDESALDVLYAFNINYAYKNFLNKAVLNSLANNTMSVGELFSDTYVEGTRAGVYLIIMFVDVFWMLTLAMLIDIFGGKLVSAVMKLFKGRGRMKAGSSVETRDVILEGCMETEESRNQATSDVELMNVVKVYPTGERAVNGLSFRAIRGQVSILLGQNGCGKSTTFSMISGVAMPTSGTIKVAGVDAVRQKNEARKFIGFCPQYNPLYDKLTVLEHLELANALKDGPAAGFMAEAKQLLQAIQLADKAGTQSSKLSGGMKRKLCVCMAMIGGSRVVLLDEPTAGMDPGARKDVQAMLEAIKVNRTILLTTHYMDEAERLGDWVFVMSYGRMAASGSLNFLKKKFGSGYLLTVVLDAEGDKKESAKLVEQVSASIVPSAKLKDQRGQMVEITLPEDQKVKVLPLLKTLESVINKRYDSSNISALPSDIRNKIQKLRITTLGLSLSSLETVFIRICDECDIAIAKEKNLEDKRTVAEQSYEKLMVMKTEQRVVGMKLTTNQFSALLRKRFYHTLRNVYQLFFQIVIPIAIVIFGLVMMKSGEADKPKLKETMDLKALPNCVAVLIDDGANPITLNPIRMQLKGFKNIKLKELSKVPKYEDLLKEYNKEPLGFIVRVKGGDAYIHYNNRITRASPVLVTLAANWFVSRTQKYTTKIEFIQSAKEDAEDAISIYLGVPLLITIAIAMVTAPFVQFGIEERVCKFAHQQHLTGMSRLVFWLANILWDSTVFIIFVIGAIVIFLSFQMFINVLHWVSILFFLLLLCILPLTYVASLMFESPSKASSLLVVYQVIIGTIAAVTIMFMVFFKSRAANVVIPILYVLCPPSIFFSGFFKTIVVKQMETDSSIQSVIEFETLWEWKGLIRDITFLLLIAFVATVTVIMMQNRSARIAVFRATHRRKTPIPKKPVKLAACQAVVLEEEIVHQGKVENCTVVVTDLVRTFGKFRAVNGLCVTVRNNECFGLLGTNGAGKTTTFDILTGLRFPSGGSAIIDGRDVVRHNYVGYCPQFDSILPDLKCIEALEIMAQLHGYVDHKLAVQLVLTCVGMVEHAHKRIRMCSGGQKRKISVGIAMLTRARCIMMDEPTAGIDPRARREIWEILDWMREKSGSSIVLTSHSMEECEALCSRMAIMRKGEMIAMGTSQDLKSQYGNTYTMTLIVNKISDRERVVQGVKESMPEAVLKTAMTNITTSIVWELPKKSDDLWSKVYEKVEVLAKKLNVKDYMLTQSSLEDTFINLTD